MKRIKLVRVLLAAAGTAALALASTPGLPQSEEGGPFKTHLQMERFSFTEDDPVMLQMVIRNVSNRKEFFVVYDTPYTTYQPVVYGPGGKEAATAVPYRLMNRRIEEVLRDLYPRIVELAPNETITHAVNLRSLYKLDIDVEYRVRGYFLPDVKNPRAVRSDNVLSFSITRSMSMPRRGGVARVERAISPSEVVLLALSAERNSEWKNYLKYIRLESFVNAFPDYVRIYNAADEVERLKILEDFAKFLTRRRSDYIKEFSVQDEMILEEGRIAYVDTVVKRSGARLPYVYKYRYTLERFKDYWLIVDLEATVLKGEQR